MLNSGAEEMATYTAGREAQKFEVDGGQGPNGDHRRSPLIICNVKLFHSARVPKSPKAQKISLRADHAHRTSD